MAALRVSSGLQTSADDFASTGIDVALALKLTAQLPKDCINCIRNRCLRCSALSRPWIFLGIPRCCGLDRELDLETDPPAKVDGEKLEGCGFGGSICRDLVAKVVKRGNPLKNTPEILPEIKGLISSCFPTNHVVVLLHMNRFFSLMS